MYYIKIIAPDQSTNQFDIDTQFINNGNVDLMALFKAKNIDPNELFDQGNTILFIEKINGIETILHTFKKWW